MRRFLGRPEGSWLVAAVIACGLLASTFFLPLWKMEMVAPQYPDDLAMYAYGYKFSDNPSSAYLDVREINGLNHYIGMKPIEEVTEMQLFIPGVAALIASALLVTIVAWRRRLVQAFIVGSFWFMPLFFVADLQYWLYNYGHSMDPDAPLNTGSFTPKVVGSTEVWNFHSDTSFEIGFYLMVAAALVITVLPLAIRRIQARLGRSKTAAVTVAAYQESKRVSGGHLAKVLLIAVLLGGIALAVGRSASAGADEAPLEPLQERIDKSQPGDTIYVEGGVYREHIVIDKPISLVGRYWPVIDGGGEGDVVTISADDASISGFVVRGSGRSISQEPGAIKVAEVDRVAIRDNRIEDSHFGIHIVASEGTTVAYNEMDLGGDVEVGRRGYGVYMWNVSDSVLHGNTIRNASDGIHLEFSEDNGIGENVVTGSRYALHFMYSDGNRMVGNTFRDNLAGAVLMFSHDLLLKDNELSSNRKGATGVGILLKDVDNIFVEGNRLLRNKFGMTVEGSPQSVGSTAVFMRNLYALNDTGIGVMSDSPITFVENALIDNTVQVKAMGGALASRVLSSHGDGAPVGDAADDRPETLPQGAVWTIDGRGNYWSDYSGHDADGDGVGDRSYEPVPPFAGRLDNEETLRLFQYTLAQQAIDVAADMFPLYRYDAVMEDAGPLMSPPEGLTLPGGGSFNGKLLAVSLMLVAISYAGIAGVLGIDLIEVGRRTLGQAARGLARGGRRA